MGRNSFTRSSVDGRLGCVHTLAVINDAAVEGGHVYLFELVLSFL